MFLDAIESFAHKVFSKIAAFIASRRQKLMEDKAVTLAFISQERRRFMTFLAKKEDQAVAEIHDLEDKIAKAEAVRSRVTDFLSSL